MQSLTVPWRNRYSRQALRLPTGSGGFYMYTAPKGRAAPFTATLAWIDVKGFDSSDGSRGRFQTVSHYSEPFSSLAHGWNRLAQTGYSELTQQGAVLSGRGGPDGEEHLWVSIQSSGGASTAVAGTHYYVMVNDKGDLQQDGSAGTALLKRGRGADKCQNQPHGFMHVWHRRVEQRAVDAAGPQSHDLIASPSHGAPGPR